MRHSPGTYEIVGELVRFDERDTVFSREEMRPGGAEELAYHTLHPELAKIDARLALCLEAMIRPADEAAQVDWALYPAAFDPTSGLGHPAIVDGEVFPNRVQVDPAVLAARIKALARRLGAADVRVGPLNPAWVYSHRGRPPFLGNCRGAEPPPRAASSDSQGLNWGDPIEISHRYAISMAFSQDRDLLSTGGTSHSDFEVGRVYALSALVATHIASYIRALGWPARAHHMRNYEVLAVPVAVDAGLGELGRCGFLIHPILGANLRLVTVTTDLPLALDLPVDLGVRDFCSRCLKCAVNCPSGAIPKGDPVVVRGVRKWQIDPVKCRLYWGYLRSGCTICQTICPWSKPPSVWHRAASWLAVEVPAARRFLVWLDDRVYGARFRPAAPPAWLRL